MRSAEDCAESEDAGEVDGDEQEQRWDFGRDIALGEDAQRTHRIYEKIQLQVRFPIF